MPKISVVMPVYNGEKYIEEAIDSILNQTFSDFEFIIIDDGSTDKTESIIKSYNDKRIKYIKNEKNLGVARSLNKGLDIAQGEYIARMDADDISLPKRFKKQLRYMSKHKDIAVCGSAIELFGGEKVKKVYTVTGTENMKINMLFGSCLYHPTVMMRASIVKKDGYRYDEEYDKVEDFELWTRIIYRYKINNVKNVLLRYRKHENQVTQNYTTAHKEVLSKVMCNFLEVLGVDSEDDERRAFIDFCLHDFNYNTQLISLISIFNNIYFENKKTGFFDKRKLKKYLSQITFSCLIKQKGISRKNLLQLCKYISKSCFFKSSLRLRIKSLLSK